MRHLGLAVLLIFVASSCDSHRTGQKDNAVSIPIVFDDWWNVDYVKNGCEMAARNNAKRCPSDLTPEQFVRNFENELEVAFATESDCHGLSLVHFTPQMAQAAVKDPNAPATGKMAVIAKPQWQLMFDLDGTSESQVGNNWALSDPQTHVVTGHLTTSQRTVQQICKIVKGVGGKVEN